MVNKGYPYPMMVTAVGQLAAAFGGAPCLIASPHNAERLQGWPGCIAVYNTTQKTQLRASGRVQGVQGFVAAGYMMTRLGMMSLRPVPSFHDYCTKLLPLAGGLPRLTPSDSDAHTHCLASMFQVFKQYLVNLSGGWRGY